MPFAIEGRRGLNQWAGTLAGFKQWRLTGRRRRRAAKPDLFVISEWGAAAGAE